MWRHRNGAVLASVVALMVGTWVAQSSARPLLWAVAALVAVGLVWWARMRIRLARENRLIARTNLSEVDQMSGDQFEEHVAGLMRVHGYTRVGVVGGASDGGVDIRAQTPDGHAVVVQCKRWRHPVPPNEVRAFLGVLSSSHRGYLGMFVASNGFTDAALREANGYMALVDRHGLALWMSGVRLPELPRT